VTTEGPSEVRDYGRELLGALVIAFGVVFLLDAAGALDAGEAIGDWWPAIVIAVGVAQLAEGRKAYAGPAIVIAAGVVLLLFTTDVLTDDAWAYIWPVILIGVGLALLLRVGRALPKGGPGAGEVLRASGIFSGAEVASSSKSFRGASLTAIFGGVTLDLREAHPEPEGARVKATAAFGGVDILVPHGWSVAVRATPILGGVDDHTDRAEVAPEGAPRLDVDAVALFGGVDIKHRR